jgi:hypothetical protein
MLHFYDTLFQGEHRAAALSHRPGGARSASRERIRATLGRRDLDSMDEIERVIN